MRAAAIGLGGAAGLLARRLEVLVLCDDCRAYQKMMVKNLCFAAQEAEASRPS
jgi:hypothetical protein